MGNLTETIIGYFKFWVILSNIKRNQDFKSSKNRHSGPALCVVRGAQRMALCVARAAQHSDLFFSYGHKI